MKRLPDEQWAGHPAVAVIPMNQPRSASRMRWLGIAAGLLVALALAMVNSACAADAFYKVPLTKLNLQGGVLPTTSPAGLSAPAAFAMQPYATLEGEGEAYFGGLSLEPWMAPTLNSDTAFLVIRAPAGQAPQGKLFVMKSDQKGMVRLGFQVPATAAVPAAQEDFWQAREAHYRELRTRNLPGSAWFRHAEEEARKARYGNPNPAPGGPAGFPRNQGELPDETYSLFTGGRAVSENLQLERTLPNGPATTGSVALASLAGIKVAPMNWKNLLPSVRPETDPLAAAIPADQHAIFFPSFAAWLAVMDEADTNGTPLLQMIEPRSEDQDSRHRYQRQLCLGLSELSRRIGTQVVAAIAVTGSDPYLRMGTDIGVLLQTKQPAVLQALIAAQQALAASGSAGEVQAVHGEIEGVPYSAVLALDRSVSSYLASRGDVVFVSNSRQQLAGLLQTANGGRPALAAQDEYVFFRSRYRRGDAGESAFLILSDATIRRWCGPKWRIADARRVQAAGMMAELQASQLDGLVRGTVQPGVLATDLSIPGSGELSLTRRGVRSSVYNTLDFLTPIAELELNEVSAREAAAYGRWRDSYQQNWTQSFDPIAVRFSVRPEKIGVELTVMPLIVRTEYRDMVSLSGGASFGAGAGDPHSGTLAHLIMSVDAKSAPMVQAGSFLGNLSPALKVNPFGWLGSSVALYADEDAFWDQLMQAEKPGSFLENHYWDLPVALRLEVGNPLGATVFLGALRAYADQTAPGMTTWQSREYQGRSYMKVISAGLAGGANPTNPAAIYYATTPGALVVTLNEALLKRAMDREIATAADRAAGKSRPPAAHPWLGTNLCLQLDERFFRVLERGDREGWQSAQQRLAWSNLPILNEWKRRYPAEDPVKLHEQYWQVILRCPGGGDYVWNDQWQTMESTVYGHPGEPREGPAVFGPLARLSGANLGLNFEAQGLSAHAEFTRTVKQK